MIYRIDVHPQPGSDSTGAGVARQVADLGIDPGNVRSSRIFLIDSPAGRADIQRVASNLLADPVVERAEVHSSETPSSDGITTSRIEVHLKPGVMDPVAASTERAIADMGVAVKAVRTGRAIAFDRTLPEAQLQTIASRVLANGVIESVHFDFYLPSAFAAGRVEPFQLRHVPFRQLTDDQLVALSRSGHLFLSLAEMQAIRTYFQSQGREPTDIELETLAQTWSEHCVHKTLKSAVDVTELDSVGAVVGRRRYGNLIKETIFRATSELMRDPIKKAFCLSVFVDNAGVIAFDDTDAVCFKVETHNHPSAIEPYGGSATGAGGVIRDILGTGLGAKPIANTDVFCVADPNYGNADRRMLNDESKSAIHHSSIINHQSLPKGVIHPKRVLEQVVAGVRDYGNRMGIPTVNGAVYFDDRYLGNPLVFCGCVGIIPRNKINKKANRGDAIVVMGGRTGRDGIHGATFSSAELTDTHADEFSHAVQIGNAITEKSVADVLLKARDLGLFSAVTDCGAGGLSSAIGEMGEKIGATVELDRVPLKYDGLRYDEIWISEAQERMVLAVPAARVDALLALSKSEDVESTVIGTFGTDSDELVLRYRGSEVGRLSVEFMHDGIPMPTRSAVVRQAMANRKWQMANVDDRKPFVARLMGLLAHPNIASKHWIIRQYDHEVQGGSVIKPLTGPLQIGPSDAAVIRPKLSGYRGVAMAVGMAPHVADPYDMAIASIDEAVRNAVAVGADYEQLAILDNFCWPSVDDELTMGTLVRACEACRDAALAFGIPFISGKDSLHNQFTVKETGEVIRIPSTLLISAIGVVPDVRRCVTMDFKKAGSTVVMLWTPDPSDLKALVKTHREMASLIASGEVLACHDISDGGIAVAAAEMCIASGFGLAIDPKAFEAHDPFAEAPGRYLIEVRSPPAGTSPKLFSSQASVLHLGTVQKTQELAGWTTQATGPLSVDDLTRAWRATLDW